MSPSSQHIHVLIVPMVMLYPELVPRCIVFLEMHSCRFPAHLFLISIETPHSVTVMIFVLP